MTSPPTPMFDSSPKPNTSPEPVNVGELVPELDRALAEADAYAMSNSDNYLVAYLIGIRSAAASALVSLQARAEATETSLAAAQTNFFTMQGAANELRIRAEAAGAERDRMREALGGVAETKVTLNQVETGEVFNVLNSLVRAARKALGPKP